MSKLSVHLGTKNGRYTPGSYNQLPKSNHKILKLDRENLMRVSEYVLRGGDINKIFKKYKAEYNFELVLEVRRLSSLRNYIISECLAKMKMKEIDNVIYSKS